MPHVAPPTPRPLDERHWALRAEVYRLFAQTGQAPSFDALSEATGLDADAVPALLADLEAHHHLALLPDRSGIWMAHPFSAVVTAFPVSTELGRFYGNCVWDALGVPALLGVDAWTRTECPASGTQITFGVQDGARVGDDAIVHFVVPPREAWDDIGFT